MHIKYKFEKIKEKDKILKVSRDNNEKQKKMKHLSYRGTKVMITLDVSLETMQARRGGSEISVERKKSTKLEFCSQKKYPSKVKERGLPWWSSG